MNNGKQKQAIAGLYAITPNNRPMNQLLIETEAALRGGANLVQFRDKSSNQQHRFQTAQALVALCEKFGKPLIVNDDIELALEAGAAGVHLGQQDSSVAEARTLLGNDAIIGATCHDSIELATQAKQQGASYLAFGRFFKSATKPDAPPASFDVLNEAKKLGLPIVAIGGITHLNAGQLLHHGINSIAVIEALFGTEVIDEINTEAITASATEFRKLFDQSL
ncbi:MAG: thiamine phosphate synthase [Pseudomonadales bacterium]|nr:thiamine phosphate synthase [Pseudomonadales bacterium]